MLKVAIEIRKRGATLNHEEGQYFLSHVYDEPLLEKKKIETQLAKPNLPQVEDCPVLGVAVSSSAEKEGRCPQMYTVDSIMILMNLFNYMNYVNLFLTELILKL